MEFSFWEYLLLFFLIGFAGLVDSIAGGGGIISVPTYIALGVPPHLILGTNKFVSTTGTSLTVFRYIRKRLIDWHLVIPAILTALVGSSMGARLSYLMSNRYMIYAILVVVPLILLFQSRLDRISVKEQNHSQLAIALRSLLIGLVIGFYDGIFGPGTGAFLIVAFILLVNISFKKAASQARVVNYASNIAAFVYFLVNNRIYWPVALVAGVASLCGNWLGSGMLLKQGDIIVKQAFRLVLVLLLIRCGYMIFDL